MLVRLPNFKMHIQDNKKPAGDTVIQMTARHVKRGFTWKKPLASNPYKIDYELGDKIKDFMETSSDFNITDKFSRVFYNGFNDVLMVSFAKPTLDEAKKIIETMFPGVTIESKSFQTFVIIPRTRFGKVRSTRRLLFTSENQTINFMRESGDIIKGLFDADPEIEMNLIGKEVIKSSHETSRVLITGDDQLCYDFSEYEVKIGDDGQPIPCSIDGGLYCEHQRVKEIESNINEDLPLRWLAYIDPRELIQSWSLSGSYYLSHVDGLQFRFLSEMAKSLQDMGKLALISTLVDKKVQPLVLIDGGDPFFGWLEGRYQGKEDASGNMIVTDYALILHKAQMKLKD